MGISSNVIFGAYLYLSNEKVVVNRYIDFFCTSCDKASGHGVFCSTCGTKLTAKHTKEQMLINLQYIEDKLEKQGINIQDEFYQPEHSNFILSNSSQGHKTLSFNDSESVEYNPQTHLVQVEYLTSLAEPIFSVFDDLGLDLPVVKYGVVTYQS